MVLFAIKFIFIAFSFNDFSEDQTKSLIKLAGSTYLLGLAILAFNLVDDKKKLKKIGIIWLIATFIVCLTGFVSVFLFYLQRDNFILNYTLSHYGSLPSGNYPRLQSTFLHQNMLANYLNVSVIFLLLADKLGWGNKFFSRFCLILFSVTMFLRFHRESAVFCWLSVCGFGRIIGMKNPG